MKQHIMAIYNNTHICVIDNKLPKYNTKLNFIKIHEDEKYCLYAQKTDINKFNYDKMLISDIDWKLYWIHKNLINVYLHV